MILKSIRWYRIMKKLFKKNFFETVKKIFFFILFFAPFIYSFSVDSEFQSQCELNLWIVFKWIFYLMFLQNKKRKTGPDPNQHSRLPKRDNWESASSEGPSDAMSLPVLHWRRCGFWTNAFRWITEMCDSADGEIAEDSEEWVSFGGKVGRCFGWLVCGFYFMVENRKVWNVWNCLKNLF